MHRCLSGVLACAVAWPALASVEHEVVIENMGFFPNTIHVAPGDTIRFVNKSTNWARLYSDDYLDDLSGYDPDDPCKLDPNTEQPFYSGSKDGWQTGWIPNEGDVVIEVTGCMETTITAPYVYTYSYDSSTYHGYVSFDAPDLGP